MFEKGHRKLVSFVVCGILLPGLVGSASAYTIIGNVDSYDKDGYNITFNCENGRVRLSFLTEAIVRVHMAPAGKEFPKDTLHLQDNTLDVYPDPAAPSQYVMYDCQTVKSPISKTVFSSSEDDAKIEVSIGASDVSYELCVHHDKEPASVVVDSTEQPRLKDKSDYDAAHQGWYYGPGCFYGSDSITTVDIKVPKTSKSHLIRIIK